ncbi:MAG: hypothetical protein LLG04_03915 [Parachlamydia sp.]|nr:hypothetical protein [Parachlamydia sp.]
MLYISGPNDSLKDLMVKEGFQGTLTEYERQFAAQNPELCAKYPDFKRKLPAFTPVFLISQGAFDPVTRPEVVKELLQFSQAERQTLRMMQDSHFDITTQIAMTDIMEELQSYASGFRSWLKAPLVSTPWKDINSSLTDKSIFKLFAETSKFTSNHIQTGPRFYILDQLYEDMMARDALNRQLFMLRSQKNTDLGLQNELERQVKNLTANIKKGLPKKIASARSKYVHRRFTPDEIRKMRANCFSEKGARTGKPVTTNLDVLNKTGLSRLRKMVEGLRKLGNGVSKAAVMLNYGVVAYDTVQAYNSGSSKDAARTFITGASAVYLTSQAVAAMGGTTALGGLVLGSLAGDAAIGATLLVCSPVIGWIIVVVTGVAVAGYVGYKAKGLLEEVWDMAEDIGSTAYQEAAKAANLVHEELKNAWSSGSFWVLEFYGH